MTKSVLYPALERAGIPRVGESGRKRDFHSFRHTFARIALEGGAEITWVKEQLGHSSIKVTVDIYGHWIPGANRQAVNKLPSLPTAKTQVKTRRTAAVRQLSGN